MKAKVLKMSTDENGVTCVKGDYMFTLRDGWLTRWESKNLKPNTDYACIMVPIPEGWELADESTKYEEIHKFLRGDLAWSESSINFYGREGVYIRPKPKDTVKLTTESGETIEISKRSLEDLKKLQKI